MASWIRWGTKRKNNKLTQRSIVWDQH